MFAMICLKIFDRQRAWDKILRFLLAMKDHCAGGREMSGWLELSLMWCFLIFMISVKFEVQSLFCDEVKKFGK